MPEPGRPPDPNLRLLGDVLSFGWVLPACLAAGGGLGWLLDRWLGSFPAATFALGLLGFAGGVATWALGVTTFEGQASYVAVLAGLGMATFGLILGIMLVLHRRRRHRKLSALSRE